MKYYIHVVGCDDITNFNIELNDEEKKVIDKFIYICNESRKDKYGDISLCKPSIEIVDLKK